MKLQKLLYFCYAYVLVRHNINLIDEVFEARPYGSVVPSVYHTFKIYGYSHIKEFCTDLNGKSKKIKQTENRGVYNTILYVLQKYSSYGDLELSKINHKVDGAWWKAKKDGRNLTDEDIKREFSGV